MKTLKSKFIFFSIFILYFGPLYAQDNASNLGLDREFLNSLPDTVRGDVLDEIKNSQELENKKQYTNIPSVALEKSETLRKWNQFLIEKQKLEDSSEIFGIDFFRNFQSTFSPTNVPNFDDNYVVDYGDKFKLQIVGQINVDKEVEVLRDGTIMIPKVGDIRVAGLPIGEVTGLLKTAITNKYIGSEVFISLSSVRDIQVSLSGRAFSPGIYTLSGNSNLIHLLNVAGGILDNGSLREVHIKRNGEIIQKVDLYDFFVDGNTQLVRQLKSGDSVVILPAKSMVRITGGVERPAVYELKENENLEDLLNLAQGFTYFANEDDITFERVENNSISTSQIKSSSFSSIKASPGMSVYVNEFKLWQVKISGAVKNPGTYSIVEGDKLSDLIRRAGGYLDNAYPIGGMLFNEEAKKLQIQNNDQAYSNIIKDIVNNVTSIAQPASGGNSSLAEVISLLLSDIKNNKPDGRVVAEFDMITLEEKPSADTFLYHKDKIHIPRYTQNVYVFGDVNVPGASRFVPGQKLEDYINNRGGLQNSAYDQIFIVDPAGNASVHTISNLGWFRGSPDDILPGSVIYVPSDVAAISGLPALSVIAPIFSSFAITLASLANLDN